MFALKSISCASSDPLPAMRCNARKAATACCGLQPCACVSPPAHCRILAAMTQVATAHGEQRAAFAGAPHGSMRQLVISRRSRARPNRLRNSNDYSRSHQRRHVPRRPHGLGRGREYKRAFVSTGRAPGLRDAIIDSTFACVTTERARSVRRNASKHHPRISVRCSAPAGDMPLSTPS